MRTDGQFGRMPGMMSSDDMDKLMNDTGAEFDQMFLTMMIEHHQGAIEMATEQKDGMYADAPRSSTMSTLGSIVAGLGVALGYVTLQKRR